MYLQTYGLQLQTVAYKDVLSRIRNVRKFDERGELVAIIGLLHSVLNFSRHSSIVSEDASGVFGLAHFFQLCLFYISVVIAWCSARFKSTISKYLSSCHTVHTQCKSCWCVLGAFLPTREQRSGY